MRVSVGKRIKKRRVETGLSVDEVADKLGKNRATIYRYESDEIENLPITVIEPLAQILNTTPSYLMGWDQIDEDYTFSTNLVTTYFNGLMKWSEDQLLEKHETTIIRGHMSDLFLRYKLLIEDYVYAQRSWDREKESFSKFYKQKENPLSDQEIKELYLKLELKRHMEDMVDWINALPSWVAREEAKYNKLNYGDTQLLPNAANEVEGSSEEDKLHDENIMDADDF